MYQLIRDATIYRYIDMNQYIKETIRIKNRYRIDISIYWHIELSIQRYFCTFNLLNVKMASVQRIVRNTFGKSQVWKHFGFFTEEDGTPVRGKAVCRICFNEILYCKNTANLCTHLERHHRSE